MAGLPAARVLADYFEHVTVLERDSLPQDTCYRSGTPQSKHVHGLLGGGQRALGNLFPAFEEDLVTAGAVQLRVGLDLRTEMLGYDPFPQRDLGWQLLHVPAIDRTGSTATGSTVRQYSTLSALPRSAD